MFTYKMPYYIHILLPWSIIQVKHIVRVDTSCLFLSDSDAVVRPQSYHPQSRVSHNGDTEWWHNTHPHQGKKLFNYVQLPTLFHDRRDLKSNLK